MSNVKRVGKASATDKSRHFNRPYLHVIVTGTQKCAKLVLISKCIQTFHVITVAEQCVTPAQN